MTDLCVLGGSEAGVAACVAAAALGLSVTLVDDGCPDGLRNPDLVLEVLHRAGSGRGRGRGEPAAWPDIPAALRRAAADRRHARLAAMNIRVVACHGRFGDGASVIAGDTLIAPRRVILAVGGRQPTASLAAAVPGKWLTVGGLSDLRQRPASALVLGGTPAAVSAAQSLQRLGTPTTLVADQLLPALDPDLAAPLLARLARDGVHVLVGVTPQLCRSTDDGVSVTLSDGTILSASHLLLAEAATPALDGLDLERAGIATAGGRLVLNGSSRTTNARVFAVGGAAGAPSTAAGLNGVGAVLRSAFLPAFQKRPVRQDVVVTATDPQIAAVGLSEQAATRHGPVQVWRWPLAQTGAGALAEAPAGHVKVVTDRRGTILGAGLVGPDVREMLAFWSLAVAGRSRLAELADVPVPTPSFSEAARALGYAAVAAKLGRPVVGRALRLARWLG